MFHTAIFLYIQLFFKEHHAAPLQMDNALSLINQGLCIFPKISQP